MKILQVKSSLFGDDGQSSRLANEFVAALLERNPGAELVVRDLIQDPVPHLDPNRLAALGASNEEAMDEQRAVVAYSDALIEELRRADVLVLGLPMYNFGVPSQLKAWYDHIARAGITFRYTESGPEGLLKGKKAYIFAARGGEYAAAGDWQAQFVRVILGFIGITDVQFVLAEGLAISEARKEASLAQARSALRKLVPENRLAA